MNKISNRFEKTVVPLQAKWNALETKHGRLEVSPHFYDWFVKYYSEVVVSGMLKPIRSREKLPIDCEGNPAAFYTNASECLNSLIKRAINYKEQRIDVFVETMEDLIRSQEAQMQEAIVGIGEWRLASSAKKFGATQSVWFSMTQKRRREHIRCFEDANLDDLTVRGNHEEMNSDSDWLLDEIDDDRNARNSGQLQSPNIPFGRMNHIVQIQPADSGIETIPQTILESIWKKPEELLQHVNAISFAPRTNNRARMVLSKSDESPRYVTTKEPFNGQFTCNCANWNRYKLGSYTVAVASLNEELPQFLEWHETHFTAPNVTRIVMDKQPKGAGRKGRIPKRKRSATTSTATSTVFATVAAPEKQSELISAPIVSGSSSGSAPQRPFFVKFTNSYVRICQGCRTYLKPDGIVPCPPEDVILGRVENRDIRTTDGKRFLKETTSHYYMQLACVKAVCPEFSHTNLFIPADAKEKLTEEHKRYICFSLGLDESLLM